jgi:hypothetical protein
MNFIQQAVEAREKGQTVPVSIGTALAIEAGCGVYPDRPEHPAPFVFVQQVWINLRTLVRNLYACLDKDVKDTALPDDLWQAGLEEMQIIETAVAQATGNRTKVVFYVSDYKRPEQLFPGAIIKKAITPKQIFQLTVEEDTLKLMLQNNQQNHMVHFYEFMIEGNHPASLIITHMPVDLLARFRFERLELLESHTGAIKKPAQWNTKLTNGKELTNIPFNRMTLQLFGDNGNLFSPLSITIRREVVRLAGIDQWTAVTSMEKVRATISGKMDNDEHRKTVLKLM